MRRFVTVMFAIGLMVIPATVAATPLPAASCENVAGTFLGQAVPTEIGFDVYVLELTGPLAGHTPGNKLTTITIQRVTPGGTIHFIGMHDFETTDFGPLVTHDVGTIAPNGHGHDKLTVVEGGAGFAIFQGTADFSTGLLDLRYHGRICA